MVTREESMRFKDLKVCSLWNMIEMKVSNEKYVYLVEGALEG